MSYRKDIVELLWGFEDYLKADRIQTKKNVNRYQKIAGQFIEWCLQKDLKEIRYGEMMDYIRYCRSRSMSPKNINRYLKAVRHFFDYLNEKGDRFLNPKEDYNPVKGMQVRGMEQTIRSDFLNEDQLEELYEKYTGKNKILLGLLVYQGLKIGEIEVLEKIHFDLKKGTVCVPKTIKGNSRTLKLASVQLYDLMEYLVQMEGNVLLGKPLQNQAQALCKKLREINPKVTNSHQLRGSRISYWVRNYDIREAQYLAGHHTVAGTEKYRHVNLEDLQNQINKYHPLA